PLTLAAAPIAVVAGVVAILERVRPARVDQARSDLPLAHEAGHFLIGYQVGYLLSLAACAALAWLRRRAGLAVLWPEAWPMPAQVLLVLAAGEAISYWQHRCFHLIPSLWRFHALHHSGARLNMVRAGRFHAVDVVAGAVCTLGPLVLLGVPQPIVGWS